MTPADITAAPEFRAGLAARLAEVGLIPPEQAPLRLAPPVAATSAQQAPEHKAA
jgi:hypothetical protein